MAQIPRSIQILAKPRIAEVPQSTDDVVREIAAVVGASGADPSFSSVLSRTLAYGRVSQAAN